MNIEDHLAKILETANSQRYSNWATLDASRKEICSAVVGLRSRIRVLANKPFHDDEDRHICLRDIWAGVDELEDELTRMEYGVTALHQKYDTVVERINEAQIDIRENQRPEIHLISDPRVRDEVLRISEGKCQYCATALGRDFHVDHFVPKSKGGPDNLANYVASCGPCNMSKSDKHVVVYLKQIKTRMGIKDQVQVPNNDISPEDIRRVTNMLMGDEPTPILSDEDIAVRTQQLLSSLDEKPKLRVVEG